MPDDLQITSHLAIPARELRFSTSRSSGPGGQHVNTTDTKVTLRWNVHDSAVLSDNQRQRITRALAGRLNQRGEIVLACDVHRSQHRNRDEVVARLARFVRAALARRKLRRPTTPSPSAAEKRLQGKRQVARKKQLRKPPEESE
jgi:ribosome-associated protein